MLNALFFRLRSFLFSIKIFFSLKRIPPSVKFFIGKDARICFTNSTRILFNSLIMVLDGASLKVGERFYLSQGADIVLTENSKLEIGDDVYIGAYSNIRCSGSIKIGDNVRLAQHVALIDSNYSRKDGKVSKILPQNIVVEKNVWIGASAVILPGIVIGEGAIVGAGSVVTKDVEKNTLVAGNPACWIKNI